MSTHHPSQLLKPQDSGSQGWLMNRQEAWWCAFTKAWPQLDDWVWVETGPDCSWSGHS